MAGLCLACESSDPRYEEPLIGLAFVPVETRTADDSPQTVAHMELTGLQFVPGERGLLVWEKSGRVAHYSLDGAALTLLGELHLPDVSSNSDCGLISIAFDPDWEQNHFIYAGHCISATYSAVTRYRFDARDYAAVPESGARVIEFGDPNANRPWHNIGAIGFFPDPERSLWILAGDKRSSANAQDLSANLGGILRIIPHRDRDGGYDPHPDNPFGGAGSDPERQSSPDLYAWGLRSPWRGAIDPRGRIWIGDVGNRTEEINLSTRPGQNFGWGISDGPCSGSDGKCSPLTDPIAWWDRGSSHPYVRADLEAAATTERVAWVGLPYAASERDPYDGLLDDATLISDMCVGFVRAIAADEDGKLVRDEPLGHMVGLSGLAQASDGTLYATAYGQCTSDEHGVGGGVYRVLLQHRDAPEPEPPQRSRTPIVDAPLGPMPPKLSETGIFADGEHTRPIERAIIYEPAFPLWSNGSDKERWLLLPPGTRIDNSRRDHWEFPVGTLFFKTFRFEGTAHQARVETRVLRRTESGWDYHAYRWRDADADILSLEAELPVEIERTGEPSFDHAIPSRLDCRSCHETNETAVIGFDELRLAADRDGRPSQLAALAAQGVFEHDIPSEPDRIVVDDDQTRDVLGYLHGNCAHCHNRSNNTMSPLDLDHHRALANLIDAPTEGSGQSAGVRVVPGVPSRSVLYLTLRGESDDPELQPMPPLGVQVRDRAAISLVRDWIAALPH